MKRCFAMALSIALACMSQPALAQATSATEKAEKRLANLLMPGAKFSSSVFQGKPVDWKSSRKLEDFSVTIKSYQGAPALLPRGLRKEARPGALTETQPLVWLRELPETPKEVELPAKPLIRLPSVDVNAPTPIPILSQPQKDRASLTDPTLDASVTAALLPQAPARTRPVPFTPINLPDPFEFLATGQLRNPPDENPVPPVIPLQKPTK